MKTEKNILIAFFLNLAFAVFELIGGILTGSVAIVSDSVHDIGDALSIGIAFLLERKSKKQPDEKYTYGYLGYSLVGSAITTLILLSGSAVVIYNAVKRLIEPAKINYNGMIIFAVVGFSVNLLAALLTRRGNSLNQKAVNLHMLEDVLGWLVVLVGAVVMRFTDFYVIDPLMSVGVAVFIIINASKNLKEIIEIIAKKTPVGVNIQEIREHICDIDGVSDVHHVHLWSIDGYNNYATMHVVANGDSHTIKEKIREELREHGIGHVTLELEAKGEVCNSEQCRIEAENTLRSGHTHHHHHH